MKVATGRGFYERYGASARHIAPDIGWALLEADGSWSEPPDACELIVLAGDAYTRAFVDTVSALPEPRWRTPRTPAWTGLFTTPCAPRA